MSSEADSFDVTVRRISDDEWELWREVRLRALAEAPEAFGSTLAYWQGNGDQEPRWRSRLVDVPLNVIAMSDDVLIGQASGTTFDARGRVELISMWVDPAVRGAGIGEALIAEVVGWARDLNAEAVVLSVKKTNTHAMGLYRRMGFVPAEEPTDAGETRMQLMLA